MLTIFGGRIRDLETVLIEERLPEGWEPRIRKRHGLTMTTFNNTVLKVELAIDEKKVVPSAPAAAPAPATGDAARDSIQKKSSDAT